MFEDGKAAAGVGADIEDPAGVQRAFANPKSDEAVSRIYLWMGETYRVKAFKFASEGRKMQEWRGEAGPVTLAATETRVRVMLKPVVK